MTTIVTDINKRSFTCPVHVMTERLLNGYYDNRPLFSYSKDIAVANYLLGYDSKFKYNLEKSKYDFYGSNRQR